MVLSIDPGTITGIVSIITALSGMIVSIIIAVRQTRQTRIIDRVEKQTNSLSERLETSAYMKGRAEEQVKQAAAVIQQVAAPTPNGIVIKKEDAK